MTKHDKHASTNSPYLRGDGAAAAYLAMGDPQGRTFRLWAEKHYLAWAPVGDSDSGPRTYRKSDIDKLWLSLAHNLPLRPAA
ncbi:MAG: hypothetical protein Q7S40_28555 [Opitutaceae bacterium]|nr:hypothetical protein [Opitutaceae bacterium]